MASENAIHPRQTKLPTRSCTQPKRNGKSSARDCLCFAKRWSLLFGCSPQQHMTDFLQPLYDLILNNPPLEIITTEPQNGRYPGVKEPITGWSISLTQSKHYNHSVKMWTYFGNWFPISVRKYPRVPW